MTCREIPQGILDSAKSLEDVYSQLGLLRNPADSSVLPAPQVIRPDDLPSTFFPYLEGAEGRDFNLSALYGQDKAGLTCVLSGLHYNETKAKEIDTEVQSLEKAGQSVDDYLAKLGTADRRSYSIYSTLNVLEYFRDKGNKDGKQNVISLSELSAWAWDSCGQTTPEAQQQFASVAIGRLHSLLGLAIFLQSEPLVTSDTLSDVIIAGQNYDLKAPKDGGWKSGDLIFMDGQPLGQINQAGTSAIPIPQDLLTAGSHVFEIQRNGKDVTTVNLTVNVPGWSMPSWLPLTLEVGGSILTLMGLGFLLGRYAFPKTVDQKKVNTQILPRPLYDEAKAKPAAQTTEFYIGRSSLDPKDLVVPRNQISSKQIRVIVKGDVYQIVNNAPTAKMAEIDRNGTKISISTDPQNPTTLNPGDILQIGGAEQVFNGPVSGSQDPGSAFERIPPKPAAPVAPAANVVLSPSIIIQNGGKPEGAPQSKEKLAFGDDILAELAKNAPQANAPTPSLRPAAPQEAVDPAKVLTHAGNLRTSIRLAIAELYPDVVKTNSDPKNPDFKPGYEASIRKIVDAAAQRRPKSFAEVLKITSEIGNDQLDSLIKGGKSNGNGSSGVPEWKMMMKHSEAYIGKEENVKGFTERMLERFEEQVKEEARP